MKRERTRKGERKIKDIKGNREIIQNQSGREEGGEGRTEEER